MPRWIAVCPALFVTLLWSTSYILNKWAFAEGIGPVTLAGLRHPQAMGGALLFYYPFAMAPEHLLGIGMLLLSGVGYAMHLTGQPAFYNAGCGKSLGSGALPRDRWGQCHGYPGLRPGAVAWVEIHRHQRD